MLLPNDIRQLLAELELISHGSTQSWNSAGGAHGESTAVMPHGELNPPHIHFRVSYIAQTSDHGRDQVLAKIIATLREARGNVDRSHVIGETREQEDQRIIVQGEGFTAQEVALRFNCTPSRVRRARLHAARSPLDGKRALPVDDQSDQRTEAQRMKADGMSVRQIAMVLGRPSATVGDWVKAA